MSNIATVIDSRSDKRTAGHGMSHPSSTSVRNIRPATPKTSRENVAIDRVVQAFGAARGQELDVKGHTTFVALWATLYPEERELAVEKIVAALLYELAQPVVVLEAMLPWHKRYEADAAHKQLRIKTGTKRYLEIDAMETWEELNLFAKPWRTRRWGTADDGIAVILGWIADRQRELIDSNPSLREYLAKHPA